MHTQRLPMKPLLSALLVALSAQGYAESTEMPRINIIADDDGATELQPGSVSIVTAEELEILQPLSTEDALRGVPGINVKGEEETAVVSNIGMRGLSAAEQKTLILEDGVPVAPGLFIGNGRYYNPRIQHIESIEILKGAASLRYGPSTIGGVINYKSKTPEEGLQLSGRMGSFGLMEGTVEAGVVSEGGSGQAGVIYTYAESDGFQDKGYEMGDLMIKAGMALAHDQWLGIKVGHYKNDANISYRGLFLEAYEDRASYNPAPDDYFLTERSALDVNHRWDIDEGSTLETVVYWSEVSRDYWRYSVDTPASEAAGRWVFTDELTGNNRSFDRIGFDSRLTLQNNLFNVPGEAEMGIRYFTEESDDTRIRATRAQDRTGTNDRHRQDSANSAAAFAQNRFDFTDRLSVTPGVRVEYYKQKQVVLTDENASESTENTEVLPGLGVTYQVTEIAQVYGSIYNAFSPATNAAALDGLVDQHLEAERSQNLEIGVRGQSERMNYEAVAFQMDFSNQIVDGNSDPNLSQQNGGETLHRGIELVFGYDLGAGFSIDSNLTYIPTSKFVGGEFDGNRISYSPEMMANLQLNYQRGPLKTMLTIYYTGSQYGSSDNKKEISGTDGGIGGIWGGELDAYTLIGLHALYAANDSLTFYGSINNLSDEKYIAGLRQGIYAGTERSFELGAKYKF